jgi:hypothetical protein
MATVGDLGSFSAVSTSIYANSVTALTFIKNSTAQRNNTSIAITERNSIPYIKLKEKTGVKYSYDYNKIDPNTGNIVATSRGYFLSGGDGIAYLPIINTMFSNKLFVSDSTIQQEMYIHKIKILPIADGVISTTYRTINFRLAVITPMQGMSIQPSADLADFSLFNRWKKLYSVTDGITNTDLMLAKIVSTSSPPATAYDLKVVFKTAPLLKTAQSLFIERTIDDIAYKTLGVITTQRGASYYQKEILLDSKNHFKHNIKLNNIVVNPDIVGGTTYTQRNVPASTVWDIGFSYDFTKSVLYPAGQTILSPLKPQCQLLAATVFYPIASFDKLVAHASSGFYTACHPDTNIEEEMTPDVANTATISLVNTWYDGFSFRKSGVIRDTATVLEYDAGNFYGIKEMSLYSSGCIKVYIRTASSSPVNPNLWEQKNTTSGICGDGWAEFLITKSDSMANYINEFAPFLDLSISLQGLLSAPVESRNDFYFNGTTIDKINKLY